MKAQRPIGVLFVCLGNICRSPIAEGAFLQAAAAAGVAARFRVDSAGVSDFHEGDPPDSRAVAAAAARGFDISRQVCRPVRPADFTAFDYILAMDQANLAALARLRPATATAWTALVLEAAEGRHEEVQDPYTGTAQDFEVVVDKLQRASRELVWRLLAGHGSAARRG